MKKIISPYKDKHGNVICDGDFTRQYVVVDFPKHEHWIYEQVRFYNNDWYLFDLNYDYETGIDEPHLLSSHHFEIEVIDKNQIHIIS
ncbi:MAG: hypothetical protein WDZ35_08655 [Crocinitomicaceae bacterium]